MALKLRRFGRTGVCDECKTRHPIDLKPGSKAIGQISLKALSRLNVESRFTMREHKHLVTRKICKGSGKQPRHVLN